MLQLLPGSGTAAGVFRDLDLISRSITPRQAVSVPADPLPGRPESLKPLLLRVSEDGYGDLYRQHLFDQYRLAVEMAYRLSARRMQANTFFLAVNTGLLTVLANLVKDGIIRANT